MELRLLDGAAESSPNDWWQLCAGWRTGVNGTRQTRRSPTHSGHDISRAQKKRLQSGWALLRRLLVGSPNPVAEFAATLKI